MNNKMIIGIVMAIAMLTGCNNSEVENNGVKQIMNAKEEAIFSTFAGEDLLDYINTGKSIISDTKIAPFPMIVDADTYQRNYDKNEVAADQQYIEKYFLVRGTVKSIDRGIGENYFITFEGGENPFMTPHAQMMDGYTDYLSKLEKGQNKALYCKGNGRLMGSAQLSECIPFANWSDRYVLQIVNLIKRTDIKNSPIEAVINTTNRATAVISDRSECFKADGDKDKCIDDINQAMK